MCVTVLIYYKGDKTEHVSFVVVSPCLENNTVAVYCFIKRLINFLKKKFQKDPKNIYYFSDSPAAWYKNKKFTDLCFHKEDLEVLNKKNSIVSNCSWEMVMRCVVDSVKRLAAWASLHCPYENQILIPQQLFSEQ